MAKIAQKAMAIRTEYYFHTYYTPTKFVPPMCCLKQSREWHMSRRKKHPICITVAVITKPLVTHSDWVPKLGILLARIEFLADYEAAFSSNTKRIAKSSLAALRSTVRFFFFFF